MEMLKDSFGDGRLSHGFVYDGPQGRPLVITTAPCMWMPRPVPVGGVTASSWATGPEEWITFVREGIYGNLNVHACCGPLERKDLWSAASLMEIMKQPSISLDTHGMWIELISSEKTVQDIKDGPGTYPMHAIKGRLYGWKLWAVEPKAKGELWLHFIETETLRCGSWRAVLSGDQPVIPELTIWKTNNHHYDYQCADDGRWVDIYEWFGPYDNSDEELVRTFQIAPDGTWSIYESDI